MQIVIIFTNSVLFHVIVWTTQLRESPTYLLILSLVASDLLFAAGYCITIILYFWPLDSSPMLCLSFVILIYCPGVSSAFNFIICLGERYIKICHPFWYANKMSRKNAIIISVIPWLMTVVISVITVSEVLPGQLINGTCPLYVNAGSTGRIIFICLATIGCTELLSFIYAISKASRLQRNQVWATTSARHNTAHKRIAYLLFFSFVFYVPMAIVVIIDSATSLYVRNASFRLWYQIALDLCMLYFAVHPVVYGWNDRNLWYHIKKLFTRHSDCS